jgi:hypothetical protein
VFHLSPKQTKRSKQTNRQLQRLLMFLGDSRQAIGTFKETVFSLPLPASRSATPRLRFEFVSNSFPNRWVFGLAFCFFCFGLLGVALFGLVG